MVKHQVAVLGAGVIGLSTAVCVQELRPDCQVTIVAEELSPHTTSDGSGGFWYPYVLGQTDPDLVKDVGTTTFRYLKHLALSPEAGIAGVQLVYGYTFEQSPTKVDDPVKDMVDDYRKLTPEELKAYPGYRMGFAFTSPIVNVTMYLQWLLLRFKKNGGKVISQKIKTMNELAGQWDVVVNCCGLGACDLLDDRHMYPVRGQVIRVEAPWITHYYVFVPEHGNETYAFPNVNSVVLGGTAQTHDWNRQVDAMTEKSIWDNAIHHLPQLTHAKKIKSWVGLRPGRTTMRLEPEVFGVGPNAFHVVHNYGHGGAGVTLHHGCAQKAAAMVSRLLSSEPKKSSLRHKL